MTIVEPDKKDLPATVDPDGNGSGALVPSTNGAQPARPLGVFTRPQSTTGWRSWITTVDHKRIGIMYACTAMVFFVIGGSEALLIRAQLAAPGQKLLSADLYNQVFTMHGITMIFLFIMPFAAGIMNYIIPLQIGARDVAFPRMNALSYWVYLFGAIFVNSSWFLGGGADGGWFNYAPNSSVVFSPSHGIDFYAVGLQIVGLASLIGSINLIVTVFNMRAPGMTMFRMPIFTWTVLSTSVLVLMVFPVLAAALLVLEIDRKFGTVVFATENGGAILWQHLFWFFGHPEVYILALPFFGITSEILPVFSRKPIFGYKGLVFATLAIAGLSMAVWAHHMYVTGAVLLPFFAFMTMLIAVPTGVKFFNWVGTMWGGSITFETPMLWTLGFLITFLFGGVTGIMLASPPLDFQFSDSYFVVAHFHYTVFGTVVFVMFAGFYFWWPKMTGKMLDERLGKIHFWLLFWGFQITFLVQHWLGAQGMPRRYADYLPDEGFTLLNQVSSFGAIMLGISTLFFLYNVYKTWRFAPNVTVDDPWGWGASLEWATSCPPPRHNFTTLPPIRSERPAFDLHHPEVEGILSQSVVDSLVGADSGQKGVH